MKLLPLSSFFLFLSLLTSCDDEPGVTPPPVLPESTTALSGNAVIKVLPHSLGWVSIQESLQPQYRITQPKRELSWLNSDFQKVSGYQPPAPWSLIDAVVHPSGQVSAVLINVDLTRSHHLEIKMLRFKGDGSVAEKMLESLPAEGERYRYFPGSLDRIRLEAYGEDVYVVARMEYNDVEAIRLGFKNGQFETKWQVQVEPDAYAGAIGIIGGGFDNFHQGDRYFFVYSGMDEQGNLYVAVPSHEDLLMSHDARFGENLMTEADPGSYDFGVAILTKLSPDGERKYSRLEGKSTKKRLLNMRVGAGEVYLLGREKTGLEPGSWDAWILSANAGNGSVKYESRIDIQDGDMFWDLSPLTGGEVLAVGTKAYVQNPNGLSVSDARLATAVVLDSQGKMVKEIELPQGPALRGSEAIYVKVLGNGSVLFAGAHNAPGTHAEIYCDGFIAVRNF